MVLKNYQYFCSSYVLMVLQGSVGEEAYSYTMGTFVKPITVRTHACGLGIQTVAHNTYSTGS